MTAAQVKQVLEKEDDFSFEMQVAKVLNDLAAERMRDPHTSTNIEVAQHGGSYTDLISGKLRQFDFRCRLIRVWPPGHTSCVLLAVECKNLHESAPLVISGRPRTEDESYHVFVESSHTRNPSQVTWVTKRPLGQQFYRKEDFCGKSLLRITEKNGTLVKDNNSTEIYDRWSQALASAVELAHSACSSANESAEQFRSIVLPMVVVPNERLWRAMYDNHGKLAEDPKTVDEIEFFIERRIDLGKEPFVFTHIHFATFRGFAHLLSRFLSNSSTWDLVFSNPACVRFRDFKNP